MKPKNFRVPNQDIKIRGHELLLINTEVFQRLYNIKQLGLADRVYTFATHTRAAHSLDCLNISQRFIDALKENIPLSALDEDQKCTFSKKIEEDTDLIRSASLLHDIMHIPYAHTLEDENGLLEKGDKSKRIDIMIDRMDSELKLLEQAPDLAPYIQFGFKNQDDFDENIKLARGLLRDVKKVLWTIAFPDDDSIDRYIDKRIEHGKMINADRSTFRSSIEKSRLDGDRFYIADLIGNTISADLLSYILRDAELTGIEMRPGFLYRLFDYIELRRVHDKVRLVIKLTKKGDWRHDVLSAIIGILNVRYALTEAVIYHHAKCEASAMLGKLAFLCNLTESEQLYNIGDEGFLSLLENKIDEMSRKSELRERANGARKLLRLLKSRRFYKRIHVVPASGQGGASTVDLSRKFLFFENRVALEEKLENQFGLLPGSIVVFCPASKMALKEAEALVVYETISNNGSLVEAVEKLNSDNCMATLRRHHQSLADRVRDVQEQYRALWKLYVFVEPSLIPLYGAAIKNELLKPENIGPGDSIFDSSYVYGNYGYAISKTIGEEVTKSVPSPDIPALYREIPAAVKQIASKGKEEKADLDWVREKAAEIVIVAKERYEDKKTRESKIEQVEFKL